MLTYAARVADGLPLVASFAPTGGPDLTEAHKREAKEILRGLSGNRWVTFVVGTRIVLSSIGN